MKLRLITIILVLFLGVFVISRVQAATPDPIIVFQTGTELYNTGSFLPEVDSICWVVTMGGQYFYIGPFIADSNTHLLVVRFLNNQPPVSVGRNVKCESTTSVTAEERTAWILSRDYLINPNKVRIVNVGDSWKNVTLTPTPSPTLSPSVTNTGIPTGTKTPVPAPFPTVIFSTKDGSDALEAFSPVVNTICWTWHQPTGRIGIHTIPPGYQLLVVKFLKAPGLTLVNTVQCEVSASIKPEERASWSNSREPGYYPWSKIITYYVGDNMEVVTLTNTPQPTLTSSTTPTPSLTLTSTETETSTTTITSTVTASNTPLPTATVTRSRTSTPSRTITPTRSKTPTATESLGPNVTVPEGVSTLVRPKVGNVCYGEIVGNQTRVIIEFVENYNSGIEISGGGCFTSNNYSLSQILRYLESRGIKYNFSSLPKPTLTPSRTLVPTATIVSYIHIGIQTDRTKNMILQPGTICWGYRVNSFEYKVVKYHKGTNSPIRITKGGCTLSENLSAEDVYNYLRRRLNLPLNGFVDVR